MKRDLRHFTPGCRDHSFRQIANMKAIVRIDFKACFLPRFSSACGAIVWIAMLSFTAREGNMAGPSVASPSSALDEEYLRFSFLHPGLREEEIQGVLESMCSRAALFWIIDGLQR